MVVLAVYAAYAGSKPFPLLIVSAKMNIFGHFHLFTLKNIDKIVISGYY